MADLPEYPLNIFDPGVKADPYPHYKAMRRLGRVVRNPLLFGQWMVTGYDDVVAVLNDSATFSSALAVPKGNSGVMATKTMLDSDPPDHERLRSVVAEAFTPRSVAQIEPRVREVAAELLVPLAAGDVFDVPAALASPLPMLVIAEMLGVAPSDRAQFVEWSHAIIASINPLASDPERTLAAEGAAGLRDYFAHEVRRQRSLPADNLVGRMVAANDDGRLPEPEMLSACVLLLLGGNETTTNLITNTALALARHPDERKRVVTDPELLPSAIEESLRYDAPVQGNARVATRDVEVGGQRIEQGSLVVSLLASANRDPVRYDDPDRFDVDRHPNPHLSFGRGIHFCLGSSLARLETRVAIGELLRIAPDYQLIEPDVPLEYGPVFFFHSPSRLLIGAGA